tara:strand:+ start:583 stop:852 length:270 start_codon:yes stop_codon:yes gene_type:complete
MLTFETTHEYHMKETNLHYCGAHDTLIINDQDYENRIVIDGVTTESLISFVRYAIKNNPELATSFKQVVEEETKTSKATTKSSKIKAVS